MGTINSGQFVGAVNRWCPLNRMVWSRDMSERLGPDRMLYREHLRSLTPQQRLEKAFALSEATRQVLLDGIRARYPDSSDEEIHELMLAVVFKRSEQEQRRLRAMGYV